MFLHYHPTKKPKGTGHVWYLSKTIILTWCIPSWDSNICLKYQTCSSNVQEYNERKSTLVALLCVLSDALFKASSAEVFYYLCEKVPLSQKLLFQREPFLTMFFNYQQFSIAHYEINFYANKYYSNNQ